MSQLPPIRRLLVEDFKTQKAWISPLVLVVNNFMEGVVNALNKGLSITDNTTGDVKTVTLSTPPSFTAPANVSWSKSLPPVAVMVGNVSLLGGATFTLSNAVEVQWAMANSNKTLAITNVVGITPSNTNQYVLTLICLAG